MTNKSEAKDPNTYTAHMRYISKGYKDGQNVYYFEDIYGKCYEWHTGADKHLKRDRDIWYSIRYQWLINKGYNRIKNVRVQGMVRQR